MQPGTLAASRTRHALAEVPGKLTPILKGKAAVVPRPDVPRAIEPEEEAALAGSISEAARLEVKDMTGFEHNVPAAEPKHASAVAEVTEVSRLEVWDMSALECETTVAEVTEAHRLEEPRLPKEATVVELEATIPQVQLRARVP